MPHRIPVERSICPLPKRVETLLMEECTAFSKPIGMMNSMPRARAVDRYFPTVPPVPEPSRTLEGDKLIDAITGQIIRFGKDHVIVENNDVAYRIFCPTRTLSRYEQGTEELVYIHMVVRDDAIQLYGFPTLRERELFRTLLPVSQVGPRLALEMLGTLLPDGLIRAVSEGNVDELRRVKGVGTKTAQRILVELRGKIGEASETTIDFFLSEQEETALKALTSKSLGFTPSEARRALRKLRNENLSLEQLIKRALEIIGT